MQSEGVRTKIAFSVEFIHGVLWTSCNVMDFFDLFDHPSSKEPFQRSPVFSHQLVRMRWIRSLT